LAETTPQQTSTLAETASFRDWDARVFSVDGRVFRGLTPTGLADWKALQASELFRTFTATGELVGTVREDGDALGAVRSADPAGEWVAALEHERVPFVSYPYEWTFSRLKDAALLQLRLTAAALAEDLMVKDASPYNVQWRGARPVFIDVGSFERLRAGEPWVAYRQFCMLYLFPLLLEAYRGLPFQPWLRASIDGISPVDFRKLFTRRDALRSGMLRHVFLHASLEGRHAAQGSNVRRELEEAGFGKSLVESNVTKMQKLVQKLEPRTRGSAWRDYRETCSYDEPDAAAKDDLVRRVVAERRRALVWDLGCNDGRYSRIASENAELTLAVDSDAAVVDDLYRALRESGDTSILPLVLDLADPSPGLGWRNAERAPFAERGSPDLVLCLALVHHLSISRNVPLREVVDWLHSLGGEVVVEFPDRGDPMVQRLLAAKRSGAHPDYDSEIFDGLLRERFEVLDCVEVPSGMRVLYFARPR
jgi:SAM-dependent methyltransferase